MTKRTPTTKKDVPPCPWCGILPRITEFKGHKGIIYYVGCETKECKVGPKTEFCDTKSKAKALWNKCKKRLK